MNPTGGLFIPEDVWKGIVTQSKKNKLRDYWAGLAVDVRTALESDGGIRQIFQDLELGDELTAKSEREPQSMEQVESQLQELSDTKALLIQWGESTVVVDADIARKTLELSRLRGE